jgi:hypothetical protein
LKSKKCCRWIGSSSGWCRDHRVGRLEVKKRGVDLDPEKLRKEIVAVGDGDATLIVTPLGGKDAS